MKKRVLLSSWAYPPVSSGSGYILYQLLRHFPQEELVAVHGISEPAAYRGQSLDAVSSQVTMFGSYLWTRRIMRRWPAIYIPHIRRRIVKLARKYDVQRIYAHYPEGCFTVAAWQAAEELGLPLTIYLDVLWEESGVNATSLARRSSTRSSSAPTADLRSPNSPFSTWKENTASRWNCSHIRPTRPVCRRDFGRFPATGRLSCILPGVSIP